MNAPRLECFDCISAATSEWHGFVDGCKGCAARAASRSWATWEARGAGRQSSLYLSLLETHGVTHDQVKAAAAADALGKQHAALG